MSRLAMLLTQSRIRVAAAVLAAAAGAVLLLLWWWRRDKMEVWRYAVHCSATAATAGAVSTGASGPGGGCAWAATAHWVRADDLLACVDLPPVFNPEVAVVRAWLAGPAWMQAATTVRLPDSNTVCVVPVADAHRSNAWVGGPADARDNEDPVDGPTQAVFYLEYYNATAALLDPEPEVAKRAPLKVKTPIPFVGTVLQTAIGITGPARAAARTLAVGASTVEVSCRAYRDAVADVPVSNCSSLFGQELERCTGTYASDPASPLDMFRLPVDEWRLRRLTWSETTGLGDIAAPWGGHKLVLLGDSTLRKLAAVWTASLTLHDEAIPCTCATRPIAQPSPDAVAHIPLKGLQDTLDGALRALKFASTSAAPGDILVVGSGLWDAAYGNLDVYRSKVRDLLVAAAASSFSRVLWVTTSAIHPGRRRMSEHAMNSVLTWHNYFTTVRVDAVNEIALAQLRRLERTRHIREGRIEVVDTTHLTRAAPWLTQPGDMVHYCPPLLVELQYLLQQQLALGSPGRDSRASLLIDI